MKKQPFVTLQAHITFRLRGKIYDMDRVLEDIIKGEKFSMIIDGRRRWVTARTVSNQGFNGQVVHAKYADGYRSINVDRLPISFQTRMIKKFDAR